MKNDMGKGKREGETRENTEIRDYQQKGKNKSKLKME